MNLKKLFLTGVLVLMTLPFALADEIGTGKTDTSNSPQTMQAADEIGTGTPAADDEIGTGSEAEAMLAWWSYLLQII